jgi:hypothetical protein
MPELVNDDQRKMFYYMMLETPKWPGNVINVGEFIAKTVKEEDVVFATPGDTDGRRDCGFHMTTEEIAENLSVSNRSVKRIIQRALAKMQSHLNLEDMISCDEDKVKFESMSQGAICQLIRSLQL